MTRKRRCHSKSNGFVTAAEQVCLQPVLKHRQRRGRRDIGDAENARHEIAGHENAAPECRGGKCET